MATRKALSLSRAHTTLVVLVILVKMIFPLSANENLKLNWLHPVRVNVPSVIFNLIPALERSSLNLPLKY